MYSISGPAVCMGDDCEIQAKGIGRIDLEDGYFNNVLFVHDLVVNLLLVYQMNHTGQSKRVTFTPNTVDIAEISTNKVVALVFSDHQARMYKFSKFLPNSSGQALLSHANETNKTWNEIFGHMNYKYLQELNKDGMVEGLPPIKTSYGACIGCVVGKHLKCSYEKGKERRATQTPRLVHSYLIGPLPTPSY